MQPNTKVKNFFNNPCPPVTWTHGKQQQHILISLLFFSGLPVHQLLCDKQTAPGNEQCSCHEKNICNEFGFDLKKERLKSQVFTLKFRVSIEEIQF